MAEAGELTVVGPGWWLANLGGMVVYGAVAARSRSRALRLGCALAVGLHVGEAVYAYVTVRRTASRAAAVRWGLQTLAVGFPSLRVLRHPDARR